MRIAREGDVAPPGPGPGRPELAGRRYVVLGDGRLVAAVIALLERRGAAIQHVPAGEAAQERLRAALETPAACVLALDDHHEANLQAALVVAEINQESEREIPVVVRAFDPALADEIERPRVGVPMRVKGAYSVAHLTAPDFVVGALVDQGEKNIVTLRLGDEYVNVCRLRVRGCGDERRNVRRPLLGRTPAQVLTGAGCQVLARRRLVDGTWGPAGDTPLEADEEVLVGGRLLDVLRLVRRHREGGPSAAPPHAPRFLARYREATRLRLRLAGTHVRMRTTQFLIALFLMVTFAVLMTPVDGASNRVYLWVLTALGSPSPDADSAPSPLVGAIGLLAGGVALGLGISLMSAYFIQLRTVETTIRRARRLRNHVVILGLGDVGLRISQLLASLGVPTAVVDTSTDEESVRRRRQAGGVPVVPADLASGLPNAAIERAFSLIATSEDNLLNVEACLRAKRATNERIRTIARIFDDVAPGVAVGIFGVDDQIAAAAVAAPAFVDAALHDECLRTIDVADWPMTALRWPAGHPVGTQQMRRWHADGVRLLAVRDRHGAARPSAEAPGIEEEQTAFLVGPEGAMEQVLAQLRGRREPLGLAAAALGGGRGAYPRRAAPAPSGDHALQGGSAVRFEVVDRKPHQVPDGIYAPNTRRQVHASIRRMRRHKEDR